MRVKPWEVPDGLWQRIEPLLPKKQRRFRYPGRKPLIDRKVLQGILFVLHTGIGWEHLPQELGFGCGMTAWRRLRAWQQAGVWEKLHELLLAELHAGAKYLEMPGFDQVPEAGNMDEVLDAAETFVQSIRAEETVINRALATVLFTDIVESTAKATGLGDAAWKDVVERHHRTVRAMIGRYRGHEIDTAGDAFFATFDGPSRAVRCALAIVEALQAIGLPVRAGLHTGEVEAIDEKAGGIAVIIGARIGAMAGPSEVVVSSTVRDLVAGSGLLFEDRGEHQLKGVPGEWRLYAVALH